MEKLEIALRFIAFLVKLKSSKRKIEKFRQSADRYRIDTIHAASLDNNPLDSPADRDLRIYLPPGYHEKTNERYPVIYFLHGYGSNNKSWTITSRREIDQAPFPFDAIPARMAREFNLDKIPTYEMLDELITRGEIEPFILVQPDGSLHLPRLGGGKDITGRPNVKGSFYVNSPHSGNYADYIARDVVAHVDRNYRTLADPGHRAVSGASMGGYGAMYLGIKYPGVFGAVASLAPGNLLWTMVDWKLYSPLYERLLGKRYAKKQGEHEWSDIVDTIDMIYSKDTPLVPSIKRDDAGKITSASDAAIANWRKFDLSEMVNEHPGALKGKPVFIYVDAKDEFGLCPPTRQLHETLLAHGIEHEFHNPDDPAVAISPHVLGCGTNILPAFKFCSDAFKR
ncbi:MAG: alpha/beta hydrolase [Candidatus Sigynarchaeota archaeon]